MRATAVAQPNIALIKYWGKHDIAANVPAVGSLSITLESLETRMSVSLDNDARKDELRVNGEPVVPGPANATMRAATWSAAAGMTLTAGARTRPGLGWTQPPPRAWEPR